MRNIVNRYKVNNPMDIKEKKAVGIKILTKDTKTTETVESSTADPDDSIEHKARTIKSEDRKVTTDSTDSIKLPIYSPEEITKLESTFSATQLLYMWDSEKKDFLDKTEEKQKLERQIDAHTKKLKNAEDNKMTIIINEYKPIDEILVSRPDRQDCRTRILAEIEHRIKRKAFDEFINHHIEYKPYINKIYAICYPDGNLRIAAPSISWKQAEAVCNKYYWDEVFWYVNLHVTKICIQSTSNTYRSITQHIDNNNKIYTLMQVLSDRLRQYLFF
jgi:hypothetical protein